MARFLIKNLSEKDWKVTVGQFNYDCGFKAKGPEEQGRLQEKILKPDSRVAFDPGSRSITMNLSYADFMDRYPTTKQYLVSRAPKTAATPKEDFINAFGTEEEKSHMAKMLEASRDHYRDFDFEDQDDPGIDPSQSQAEQTKALLGKVANPGILLGGGHGDKNTKDLLIDNMKNGTISPGAGTGLVFIEEIKAVFQPLVDEYLDGPDDAPLPGVLGALFEKLGNQMPYQDFAGILKTAKEKKVRVYGLDTGDANPECSNTSAQHPEQRCGKMNYEAERVMNEAMAKHPGQKFIALVGAAHSNTHEGGIPGLAQVFKAPAVRIDDSGKLQWDPEDPTKREMPSKAEQQFIDRYIEQVEKAATEQFGPEFGKGVNVNKAELRANATARAKVIKKMGGLENPADVNKALADGGVQDHINGYVELMKTRHQRRKDLKKTMDDGDAWEVDSLLGMFLQDDPDFLTTEPEATGTTLLHYAAEHGKDAHMGELIKHGADVNATAGGKSALHAASSVDAVRLLTTNGANPNALDKDGHTPLYGAAAKGQTDVAKELIARGGDVNRPGFDNVTPLQIAVTNGHSPAAKELIAKRADHRVVDARGQTPLHLAAASGRTDMIEALVTAGADINAPDAGRDTPLLLAIAAGKGDTAREILTRGGDPNKENDRTHTRPVHLAAEKDQGDLVSHLAGNGADLQQKDGKGRTGLEAAFIEKFKQQARETTEAPQQAVKDAQQELTQAQAALETEQQRLQDANSRLDEINEQIKQRNLKRQAPGALADQALDLWNQVQQLTQAVTNANQVKQQKLAALNNAKLTDPLSQRLAGAEADLLQAKNASTQADSRLKTAEKDAADKDKVVKDYDEQRKKDPTAVDDTTYQGAVQDRDDAASALEQARKNASSAKSAFYSKERMVKGLKMPFKLEEEEIDQIADVLVKDLLRAGTLTSLNDIDGLVAAPKATRQITDVIGRTIGREVNKKELQEAIKARDLAKIQQHVRQDLYILNQDLDPLGAPGSIPLHIAAKEGYSDVFDELIKAGADVEVVNQNGRNALHVACDRRVELSNPAKQADQLKMVKKLVALGVDLNAQDKSGKTALHLASRNPNAGVVSHLLDSGADEKIQDNRGWKAVDVAVSTTKPHTEEAFYEHSKDPTVRKRLIGDDEKGLDTLTVLMRATKCENPKDLAKMEETYKELYANPLFRPIMDLAALDACLERKAPMLDDENEQKGGGLRIFVADSPQVGELYNAPSKHDAPQGAFEQDADVLMFGAREGEGSHYFAGTVIHELTHMAARILYGQETIPCPPDPTAGYFDANGKMKPEMKDDPYVEAIMKDMRQISLCEANDPVENEVLRTMAGRMNDSSYRNRGDLAFLQEFLVGVPQMITEFGEDAVTKLSPELANYFSDTFLDKCRDTIAFDDRYSDIYSKQFDNTALIKTSDRRPPVRPPAPETWLDNGNAGTKPDAIAKKIEQYYTSQHGDVVVPPEGKAAKTSLPYSTESFAIPQRYQADVARKMQVITKALQDNLSDEDLLEQVSADVMRNLVKDMSALAHTSSERELKKVVKGRVAGFKREAAKTYLEREVALGHELTNEQVAEIVLMRAEDAAWQAAHPTDDGIPRPEFNPKTHKALVKGMQRKIAETIPHTKWSDELIGNPDALDAFLNEQVKALTNAQKTVYTKAKKPDEVLLDEKNIKRAWYVKLQQLSMSA